MTRVSRFLRMATRSGLGFTANHILSALAVRLRPSRLTSWPRFIQIEVTSRCNMACVQCSRSTLGAPSSQGHMSLALFEQILGQFKHYQYLTLHGLGEPLLNPHLEEMIRVASRRSRDVRIGFNTNGLLLKPERVAALARAGLHEIGVSLDAATEETFRKIRGPHDFQQVKEQIRAIVSLNGPRPDVGIAMVVMQPNVGELTSFVEMGADLGVQSVSLCDLSHRWRPTDGDDPMAVQDLETAWRETARAEARAAELELPFVYTKLDDVLWPGVFVPCFYLWDYPYVTWDGKLTPCCALPYAETFSFGDLKRTPFRELWNSREYRQMRADLRRGHIPKVCEGCHHAEDPALGHVCTCKRDPEAEKQEDP